MTKGCKFEKGMQLTDFVLNEETGSISEVVCDGGVYNADAVVLAVGISTLQKIIENRYLTNIRMFKLFSLLSNVYSKCIPLDLVRKL